MRSTFDLPDNLVKRAKIAAVKRGSTLRDLVAEGLRRVLSDEQYGQRKRMTEAPVKLPPGHSIPVLSNGEIAMLFSSRCWLIVTLRTKPHYAGGKRDPTTVSACAC
jgi:hypothetical protein